MVRRDSDGFEIPEPSKNKKKNKKNKHCEATNEHQSKRQQQQIEEKYKKYSQNFDINYVPVPLHWDIDKEDYFTTLMLSKQYLKHKSDFIIKIKADYLFHREVISAAKEVLQRNDLFKENLNEHIALLEILVEIGGVVSSEILQVAPQLVASMICNVTDNDCLQTLMSLLAVKIRPHVPSVAHWKCILHPISNRVCHSSDNDYQPQTGDLSELK